MLGRAAVAPYRPVLHLGELLHALCLPCVTQTLTCMCLRCPVSLKQCMHKARGQLHFLPSAPQLGLSIAQECTKVRALYHAVPKDSLWPV